MKRSIRRTSIDIGGGSDPPKMPGRTWPEGEDLTGKLGKPRHQSASLLRHAERSKAGRKASAKREKGGSASPVGPLKPAPLALPGGGVAGLTYGLGRVPRVIVKAKYRVHQPRSDGQARRGQPLREHLVYLARPEAQRLPGEEVECKIDGPVGVFFGAERDAVDVADLPHRWQGDRHHWRLIVSPQDARRLDLTAFARGYAARLEDRLDTPLEWAGIVHVNTDHPHVHLLIRGRRNGGRDLVMPASFVAEGLRGEAELELLGRVGPRTEAGADAAITTMARLRRPTPLDGLLAGLAADAGGESFKLPADWLPELAGRHHLTRRLELLEGLGLAARETRRPTKWGGVTQWSLAPGWQTTLDATAAAKPAKGPATAPKELAVRKPQERAAAVVKAPAGRGGAEL